MDNSELNEDPPSYEQSVAMTPTETIIVDMLTKIIDILELIIEYLNN